MVMGSPVALLCESRGQIRQMARFRQSRCCRGRPDGLAARFACARLEAESRTCANRRGRTAVERVDVAIVGGGIVGSAVAYFLGLDPGFRGSVAIIERDIGYRDGSTARSAGGLRQQFSTPEN